MSKGFLIYLLAIVLAVVGMGLGEENVTFWPGACIGFALAASAHAGRISEKERQSR